MKPGTFTQMYVQLVFAEKNRDAALTKEIRPRVFEYSALAGSPGRMVMEDLLIVIHKLLTSTITLRIRNLTIRLKHSMKNISTILLIMRWNLINNFCLNFGRIPFNLYEVRDLRVTISATTILYHLRRIMEINPRFRSRKILPIGHKVL